MKWLWTLSASGTADLYSPVGRCVNFPHFEKSFLSPEKIIQLVRKITRHINRITRHLGKIISFVIFAFLEGLIIKKLEKAKFRYKRSLCYSSNFADCPF